MIATLAQLHHGVHEIGHVGAGGATRQELKVLLENGTIVLLLGVGELDLDDGLLLGREILLDVLLETTQHHRFEQRLQLAHLRVGLEIAELLQELAARVELLRLEEVEQREQLLDVVLQRRAREQHLVLDVHVAQALDELAVLVFETMRLVDYHVAPLETAE